MRSTTFPTKYSGDIEIRQYESTGESRVAQGDFYAKVDSVEFDESYGGENYTVAWFSKGDELINSFYIPSHLEQRMRVEMNRSL
jgi:hypothetical protein